MDIRGCLNSTSSLLSPRRAIVGLAAGAAILGMGGARPNAQLQEVLAPPENSWVQTVQRDSPLPPGDPLLGLEQERIPLPDVHNALMRSDDGAPRAENWFPADMPREERVFNIYFLRENNGEFGQGGYAFVGDASTIGPLPPALEELYREQVAALQAMGMRIAVVDDPNEAHIFVASYFNTPEQAQAIRDPGAFADGHATVIPPPAEDPDHYKTLPIPAKKGMYIGLHDSEFAPLVSGAPLSDETRVLLEELAQQAFVHELFHLRFGAIDLYEEQYDSVFPLREYYDLGNFAIMADSRTLMQEVAPGVNLGVIEVMWLLQEYPELSMPAITQDIIDPTQVRDGLVYGGAGYTVPLPVLGDYPTYDGRAVRGDQIVDAEAGFCSQAEHGGSLKVICPVNGRWGEINLGDFGLDVVMVGGGAGGDAAPTVIDFAGGSNDLRILGAVDRHIIIRHTGELTLSLPAENEFFVIERTEYTDAGQVFYLQGGGILEVEGGVQRLAVVSPLAPDYPVVSKVFLHSAEAWNLAIASHTEDIAESIERQHADRESEIRVESQNQLVVLTLTLFNPNFNDLIGIEEARQNFKSIYLDGTLSFDREAIEGIKNVLGTIDFLSQNRGGSKGWLATASSAYMPNMDIESINLERLYVYTTQLKITPDSYLPGPEAMFPLMEDFLNKPFFQELVQRVYVERDQAYVTQIAEAMYNEGFLFGRISQGISGPEQAEPIVIAYAEQIRNAQAALWVVMDNPAALTEQHIQVIERGIEAATLYLASQPQQTIGELDTSQAIGGAMGLANNAVAAMDAYGWQAQLTALAQETEASRRASQAELSAVERLDASRAQSRVPTK